MTINYQFGDVDAHGAMIRALAGLLEAEHQAIISDVLTASDFWGGAGSAACQGFITQLGRNFQVIYDPHPASLVLHRLGVHLKTARHVPHRVRIRHKTRGHAAVSLSRSRHVVEVLAAVIGAVVAAWRTGYDSTVNCWPQTSEMSPFVRITEPPRHVRRLQFLERMGSCQVVHRGGTRRSCVSGTPAVRPDVTCPNDTAADPNSSASPSHAAAAASNGLDPAPEYISTELISGGRTGKFNRPYLCRSRCVHTSSSHHDVVSAGTSTN